MHMYIVYIHTCMYMCITSQFSSAQFKLAPFNPCHFASLHFASLRLTSQKLAAMSPIGPYRRTCLHSKPTAA